MSLPSVCTMSSSQTWTFLNPVMSSNVYKALHTAFVCILFKHGGAAEQPHLRPREAEAASPRLGGAGSLLKTARLWLLSWEPGLKCYLFNKQDWTLNSGTFLFGEIQGSFLPCWILYPHQNVSRPSLIFLKSTNFQGISSHVGNLN